MVGAVEQGPFPSAPLKQIPKTTMKTETLVFVLLPNIYSMYDEQSRKAFKLRHQKVVFGI